MHFLNVVAPISAGNRWPIWRHWKFNYKFKSVAQSTC